MGKEKPTLRERIARIAVFYSETGARLMVRNDEAATEYGKAANILDGVLRDMK